MLTDSCCDNSRRELDVNCSVSFPPSLNTEYRLKQSGLNTNVGSYESYFL